MKNMSNKAILDYMKSLEKRGLVATEEYVAYQLAMKMLVAKKKDKNPFYVPTMRELGGNLFMLKPIGSAEDQSELSRLKELLSESNRKGL